MSTTRDWLRERDDAALRLLLQARPDLAVPAPTDLAVLARRLDSAPSVWRVMESLNAFQVQVLQARTVLGPEAGDAAITALLGPGATIAEVADCLAGLESLGLLRRNSTGWNVADPVPGALGEFPAGLGPPGELSGQALADALTAAGADGTALLQRLAQGQPRGVLSPGSPGRRVAEKLIAAGLLLAPDSAEVLLPREVCLALRGDQPLGPVHPALPPVDLVITDASRVDGTAAGQALQMVGAARAMLQTLLRIPAPALRSGGMGVRETRRLAKELDLPENRVALLAELLAGAGLLAVDDPRGHQAPSWTTSAQAAPFLDELDEQAWARLVAVWLDLRREPARAGSKDSAGKSINLLAPEMSWVRGPADRRFVLGLLAGLPPGTGAAGEPLTTLLAWSAPLRAPERRDPLARTLIDEATWLGLVAFDALSAAGRALLAGESDEVIDRLQAALPAPVDQVLVQADLTVVAPGRLTRELSDRLAAVADVESVGSGTVYRVTGQSLRRAFDAGVTASELHRLFAVHSATGVPQALDYLIDDVARRHGSLRVGSAGTYLRSDDPALIDAAMAQAKGVGLLLRRLAPTVAVAGTPVGDLVAALAVGGLLPAAEDATGAVLDLSAVSPRRLPGAPVPISRRDPPPPGEQQLDALIARMRAADRASAPVEQTPGESMALLRKAAQQRQPVWIGYVDAEGATTRRQIEPIAVSGGTVAAFDRLRGTMRTFALHRITGIGAGPGDAEGEGSGGAPDDGRSPVE